MRQGARNPTLAARLTCLGGLAAGLAASPVTGLGAPGPEVIVALALGWFVAWFGTRRPGDRVSLAVLAACAVLAAATGLALGAARVQAIDGGAFAGSPGARVTVRGFVDAVPRRLHGQVRVPVQTADGRLLLAAPEPVPSLAVGHEVEAEGIVREPEPWEAAYLARLGIARVVEARAITAGRGRRGGVHYLLDRVRERAEEALTAGTAEPEAALLRGFVLGEDDRIAPATVDEFQRSGLAHLLAVSGQNVMLLALLAAPLLGLLGVPLRARLLCVLVLIAIYVPVAGGGPSIQRAGVMGAAGVAAALASRPSSRGYAMLVAAAVTLGLNPRAAGDVGWQLSFAAVAGIALWAQPLRAALAGGAPGRSARGALSEAAALTLAATVATAPLMAHHFERISLMALPANLMAAPAVAPVMWLGMLAAAAGQLSWLPAEPFTWLAGVFAAYVEQVAHWLGAPAWAQASVPPLNPLALAGVYIALGTVAWLLVARHRARRHLRPRLITLLPLIAAAGVALLVAGGPPSAAPERPEGPALRVRVLDVGQGDAIVLDPDPGDPVLVDTGPAQADVAQRLSELGIDRLAAVLITHDQSDHAGGLADVLAAEDVAGIGYGEQARPVLAQAAAAGIHVTQLHRGSTIRSGALEIDVLWPPEALLGPPRAADANTMAVVGLARWRAFSMLLTADAEAEAVPLDPGPVDVLKLAHHGSEDAGLARLLQRATPRLAVASVGAGNPYGHPAPETLATLADEGVPLLRTDLVGDVELVATPGRLSVTTHG